MIQYLDFEIHIAVGTGQDYPVSVIKSPAGEASGTLRIPLDPSQLSGQLQGIEAAVKESAFPVRGVAMDESSKASVKDFGKLLFESLFVEQVHAKFRMSQDRARLENKGLRIRLRIDAPDLTTLPWEFLYDHTTGDYVALSSDTPLVRFMASERPPETLTVQPPISILAMVASPNDRPKLNVKRERERMEAATKGLQEAGLLRLEWLEGSTWRDLQAALRKRDYHIFHFVGHGGFDPAQGEGVLAFTNEDGGTQLMTATQVGRLLADERTLRLVVLNACLGAKGNTTDVFSSTSATLVRRGVPAVVAMQYEISDDAAIEFSRSLYEALGNEMPVDAAVGEARKAVSMVGDKSVEWGTPVLHMRSPNGELFKIDGTTTKEASASGVYRRMPSRAELQAQSAAPAPSAPPPAASPMPPVPTTPVPPVPTPVPPAPTPVPPAPPAAGGKKWSVKQIVVGVFGVIGLLFVILLISEMAKGDGSDTTPAAGAAGAEDSMAVQFALDSLSPPYGALLGWRRDATGSCGWTEDYRKGDSIESPVTYTQVPDDDSDVHLVAKNVTIPNTEGTHTIHLFLPRQGGWVESFVDDTGHKAEEFTGGSRVHVTPALGPVPASGLPKCELSPASTKP
jgi:hypothetical protein